MDSEDTGGVFLEVIQDNKEREARILKKIKNDKINKYTPSLEDIFKKERLDTESDMFFSNVTCSNKGEYGNLARDIVWSGAVYLADKFGYSVHKISDKLFPDFEGFQSPSIVIEEGTIEDNEIATDFIAFEGNTLFAACMGVDDPHEHRFSIIGRDYFINQIKNNLSKKTLDKDIVNCETFIIDGSKVLNLICLHYNVNYDRRKGNKITFI